jgi:hypothetical protein
LGSRLRVRLVGALSERTLRRIQRIRHFESPSLRHAGARGGPRGVTPQIVTAFDAHAVREDVAELVASALEAAGVPYLRLPGARGAVAQMAVEVAHRPAALAALERVAGGPGWAVEPAGERRRRQSARIEIYRVLAAPNGRLLCGLDTACQIAFWRRDAQTGDLDAPAGNAVLEHIRAETWQQGVASPGHWPVTPDHPYALEVREPVDVVYTWVNGDDPRWQERKAAYTPAGEQYHYAAVNNARYANRDELRYSMRSLAMFAGWVRQIYIVTDQQVPDWLDTRHPRIRVVDHREVFTDPDVLPVFNSHAIESQLQHVPGLAEQFLYFNDDVFFGRPVEPELFFFGNGIAKFFLSAHTVDLEPPSLHDLPVMSAAKNNRALLQREFGITVRHKMKHTAHPQLRSVLVEMEKRHPELFAKVAASRFRHPDDVSVASSLHHYYAFALGRAVPGTLQYRYQDISRPNTARRLDEFLRQRPQVFCLNDLDSSHTDLEQRTTLREFLDVYFPLPAPWERDG